MIRRPPRSTRTDTLFPYTTLFRSCCSRPAPQLVDFSVWPTMKGGTPKKRHISSTEKARLSSICASSGLIVSCCHCMRSEEHTSELQSLMRISYAVFCLKKKKQHTNMIHLHNTLHISTISTNTHK